MSDKPKVPIDVMRDIRIEAQRLKQASDKNRMAASELIVIANVQKEESEKLRDMADKWAACFPGSEDPLK